MVLYHHHLQDHRKRWKSNHSWICCMRLGKMMTTSVGRRRFHGSRFYSYKLNITQSSHGMNAIVGVFYHCCRIERHVWICQKCCDVFFTQWTMFIDAGLNLWFWPFQRSPHFDMLDPFTFYCLHTGSLPPPFLCSWPPMHSNVALYGTMSERDEKQQQQQQTKHKKKRQRNVPAS